MRSLTNSFTKRASMRPHRPSGTSPASGGRPRPAILYSLCTILFATAGCSSSYRAPDTGPSSTQVVSTQSDKTNTIVSTNGLGTQQKAGPYSVVLMSPSEIKPGDAQFMAHVTKDGKNIENAKVNLDLSMPSMNMDGPHVELKHSSGSAYEGNAKVMASPYAAKVDVEGPDGKGTAEFDFTVK